MKIRRASNCTYGARDACLKSVLVRKSISERSKRCSRIVHIAHCPSAIDSFHKNVLFCLFFVITV